MEEIFGMLESNYQMPTPRREEQVVIIDDDDLPDDFLLDQALFHGHMDNTNGSVDLSQYLDSGVILSHGEQPVYTGHYGMNVQPTCTFITPPSTPDDIRNQTEASHVYPNEIHINNDAIPIYQNLVTSYQSVPQFPTMPAEQSAVQLTNLVQYDYDFEKQIALQQREYYGQYPTDLGANHSYTGIVTPAPSPELAIDAKPFMSIALDPASSTDSTVHVFVSDALPKAAPKRRSNKNAQSKTQQKLKKKRMLYENGFICELCDRSFARQSSFAQHNKIHHSGPRDHRCMTCGKRFHLADELQKHQLRHLATEKDHPCSMCSKQFHYRSDLSRHYSTSHGQAQHRCQQCGKGFGRADHLSSHLISHANQTVRDYNRSAK